MIGERKKSPTGRWHVHPQDKVVHARGSGIGTVLELDSLESHTKAKVRWPTGHASWEDLNVLVLRTPRVS